MSVPLCFVLRERPELRMVGARQYNEEPPTSRQGGTEIRATLVVKAAVAPTFRACPDPAAAGEGWAFAVLTLLCGVSATRAARF
jgi:hypothetical protein